MNIKKLLLATLVVFIFSTAWVMLTCGWLFNWVYLIPPIIWKTPAAMMETNNIIGSNLVNLVSSFIFVLVYAFLYKGLPYSKGIQKGMFYGLIVYLISVSGIIGMPFYMTIAYQVIAYWLLNFLIHYIILGILTGMIYKK